MKPNKKKAKQLEKLQINIIESIRASIEKDGVLTNTDIALVFADTYMMLKLQHLVEQGYVKLTK